LGLASHASLFIDKPTIGIAKNKFIGEYKDPKSQKGSFEYITFQKEILGATLRTRDDVKPVYVSVGNNVSLDEAIEYTLHFSSDESRVPEIIRAADKESRKLVKNT
jgi:deoxyribonuclease V